MKKGRFKKFLIGFTLLTVVIYGLGRLYFEVTAGFTIGNITSDFKPDPRWDTQPLTLEEQKTVSQILSQSFHYLGKGCQSYVFESEDGKYVIKFFKYQRYRPKFWLDFLTFIGPIEKIRERSAEKKRHRIEGLFTSWKIGYDQLRHETGLVYVHLNKGDTLNQQISIFDKMGFQHTLDADKMEFLIQKKAKMLCATIDELMAKGQQHEAEILLSRLVKMIVGEYNSGYADNDHALMQNTGVYEGTPIHVDVGQFVYDERMKNPEISHQEIFNKMYKFRVWLQQTHAELIPHLDKELTAVLGDRFYQMKFIPKIKD